MGIRKKLLLAFTAMAIAMSAFASAAVGADGVMRDNNGLTFPIANGTRMDLTGWWRFQTLGTGVECHVTSTVEATGSEGKTGVVTAFSPITSTCHGFGSIYRGCKVESDTTENLPYKTTITALTLIGLEF